MKIYIVSPKRPKDIERCITTYSLKDAKDTADMMNKNTDLAWKIYMLSAPIKHVKYRVL